MTDKTSDTNDKRAWNVSTIFWGGLFLTLGVLALLNNLAIIDVAFSDMWRLWPLVLIAIGVSLLRLSGWLGTLVKVAFGLLVIGSIVYVTANPLPTTETAQSSVVTINDNDDIDRANVTIEYGAGELTLASHDSPAEITRAELTSYHLQLKTDSSVTGSTKSIAYRLEGTTRWQLGNWRNDLGVSITENYPVDLTVNTGAADMKADLSQVQLESLRLRTGASSVDLILGDQSSRNTVDIEAGASSIVVRVPQSAGIRVEPDGTFGSTDYADLVEVNGNYQSPDYDTAQSQIVITLRIGAASFTLERY